MDKSSDCRGEAGHGEVQAKKLALEVLKLETEIQSIPRSLLIQKQNGIYVAVAAFLSLFLVGMPQLFIAYKAKDTTYSQEMAKLILSVQLIKDDGERGRMLRLLLRVWPEDVTLRAMLDTNPTLTELMAGDDTLTADSNLPINASKDQICADAKQRLEGLNKYKIDINQIAAYRNNLYTKKALESKIDIYRCP